MKSITHQFCVTVLSLGFFFVVSLFLHPQVRAAEITKAAEIAEKLRPALGELCVSSTPVRLPTWLPDGCTGPLGIGGGPFKDGYEVWLGTCSADTTFFTSAGKGKVTPTKTTARLADGTTAYVQNLKDFCIDWASGPYCYRVGGVGNVATLVKIANSMKQVPVSLMNAQPRGDDRLAEHYRSENESAEASRRATIGQLYDTGIAAVAKGKYSEARTQLLELSQKWTKCYEMRPLAQVKMALALVLKKMNDNSAAQEVEQECAQAAQELETELKKAVSDSLQKYTAGEGERYRLAESRRNLADLYLAEGKFEEAETVYKTAFNDYATVWGRQHPEAIKTANSYGDLLRLWGKDPAPAKQLVIPKTSGHAPVRLELPESPAMKKNGAGKLVVVLEDEYGAPVVFSTVWFTKKASFQGEKDGKVIWKLPLKLVDGVPMDETVVDVKGNMFTLLYQDRTRKQQFLWDGTKLTLKSVVR